MSNTSPTIIQLNRFPIKGLSAERLKTVMLAEEEGFPGDRLFGFARFNSGFDPKNPKPLPKDRFVVLLKVAGLAGLKTVFHDESQVLEIANKDEVEVFDMRDPEQSAAAARFLDEKLNLPDSEPPTFVSSAPHRFTDVSVVSPQMMSAISVINLNSVRDFEARVGANIHVDRFRANIVVDGLPPYQELEAMDATLTFGDVSFRILSRTKRCAATEVNPDTAERDLKIPYLLRKELGHMDMGVYVEVASGGTLNAGQVGVLQMP
ncbi:MOSC domain-containing protein [uncultured Tateyamaria sp.]|uniref:MOSC domain-containing protein n=1 Tax=uncultured Tateyamaria sp. TaxID=455651 RepID=UPI002606990E|nr:MOSC domain-containing protein [uncultured Tateyamaria sp.]